MTDVGSRTETELSVVDSLLQLSKGHFDCQHTLFFAVDMVFLRVGLLQSVDNSLQLSTGLGVSAVSNSDQELIFEFDLNSDLFRVSFIQFVVYVGFLNRLVLFL